ncbi:glutathione S-transferase N-terminal domain-containing protein [Halomonas sp. NyZ770]|uniref:glutathione S-transferase N-terminal domain-containing protein n=1 Tax=Halomonas sp. NyZ770 TaxID=2883106 RepID=UPI001D0AECDE|nr:glutathione S-transferase N-terminal domain-containing protein [Halomonas sp. NyZ770]UDM07991.1 glutathione S-transferase N-terminal domain-containing protein [Halomonas sp. NyZ770]
MAITLYDLCGRDDRLRFSPYCWRVRMALAHKGLAYTTVAWRFQQKEALAFAHYDKVPVLTDGDTVVTDSFDILRYLDTTYPEAPVLGDGLGLQRVTLFKQLVDRSITPALFRIVVLDLLEAIHPEDREYFRTTREARFGASLEAVHDPEKGRQQLHQALVPASAQLKETPFLDGDSPAGADYLLFGSMMWAYSVSTETLVEERDPVAGWFQRMLAVHDGVAGKAMTIRDLY